MTVMGKLADAVEATVEALDAEARETVWAGACALALRFADELDSAHAVADRARRFADAVRAEHGTDSALYEEAEALRAKLAERGALDRIGARLQSSLESLCATPKARGSGTGTPPKPGSGALGQLRAVSGGSA